MAGASRATANHVEKLKLCGSGKTLRFCVRRGRENSDSDHRMWLREGRGGFEILSIQRERDVQICGREMRSESERQTELRGQPGAEVTRTEQIERDLCTRTRHRLHRLFRHRRREVGL